MKNLLKSKKKNKKEELVGNSGCKLTIFKNETHKVRKQSTNLSNSKRLFDQYIKIKNFKEYKKIVVPKIFDSKKSKNLFFYDMEYINGSTLSLYLINQPFSLTKKVIENIFNFIFYCKKNSTYTYNEDIFDKKIKKLEKLNKHHNIFFRKVFKKLKSHKWNNIKHSNAHGDLSLENIIIKEKKISFIDLSENFINCYKLDISKILFDIISCWSFRSLVSSNPSINIESLKSFILMTVKNNLSKKDFLDIKMLIILDFLRVLQYTKNINDINLLLNKFKLFYDNFDNSLRW